jgi:hypothetical protein
MDCCTAMPGWISVWAGVELKILPEICLCAMRHVAENKTVIIYRIAWVNFGL